MIYGDLLGLHQPLSVQKCLNTLRFRSKLFHAMSIVYSFSRGDCSYLKQQCVCKTLKGKTKSIVTFSNKAH